MSTYYLYVKTHNITGLKYLGYTRRPDYHKYTGSGERWLAHLNKHGFNYSTQLIYQTDNKELLSFIGLTLSHSWNVVKSNLWANLKEEAGDGGSPAISVRQQISKARMGMKFSEEHKTNLKIARNKRIVSEETKARTSQTMLGKPKSQEHRQNISKARIGNKNPMFGTKWSEERRAKTMETRRRKQITYLAQHPPE